MDNEFKNKMLKLADEININLKEEEIEKFYNYMNIMLEWNGKVNLTAITEKDDVILKHFIDSMTILKYIEDTDREVIDVGSGAGFPGIPIAILKPKIKMTLVDSLNKRILFLQDVIEKLKLRNVKTLHSRAEDFGRIKRECFNISTARAVANLSTLAEYLLPLVKKRR